MAHIDYDGLMRAEKAGKDPQEYLRSLLDLDIKYVRKYYFGYYALACMAVLEDAIGNIGVCVMTNDPDPVIRTQLLMTRLADLVGQDS